MFIIFFSFLGIILIFVINSKVKIDNAEEALAYGVEAPALVYFENTIPHLFEGNLASDNEVLGWLIHQMKNDLVFNVIY